MGQRATIADVAREAGVSGSTASVVFSGKAPVAEATRARVLAAAERIGYTGPDPRAAALRRGKSGIVGVVFDEDIAAAFLDRITTLMMDGLAAVVGDEQAALLLLRDNGQHSDGPSLATAPIDAAVLLGCRSDLLPQIETTRARGVPVVVVEGDAGEDIPRVTLEHRDAQRTAAEHLARLGHRDVVALTLPRGRMLPTGWFDANEPISIEPVRERLAGARDIFPDARAYAATTSSIDAGYEAGRAILGAQDRPTAILAQSDLLAAGVIRAALSLELRVPEDVSVTGFDGITVDGIAPYEITTVVQDAVAKGRAAGEAVLASLAGREAETVRLTCEFRSGNTTASPAVSVPRSPR